MNLPFFNRDASGAFVPPADGFFHLVPKGEHPHPESGLVQVIDDEAITSIVNRFNAESQQKNFPGLLVDFEHFSYDSNKPSSAAGWITEMQNRADGIWGKIRWSDDGDTAVKNGRYRLVSPVWLPNQVQQLGNKRVRPLRLDTAGLTNNPNLRGMVPLSNRSGSTDPADNNNPTQTSSMKRLCTALGLSADASEEAALAELTKLQNRATTAEAALEPGKTRVKELETENTQLKNRNTELLGSVVEQDLEKYSNRFKPEAKDKWKASLLANRAGAIELLESLPEPDTKTGNNGAASGENKPLHNRANTKNPAGSPGTTGDKEAKRAKAISNRAQSIMNKEGKTAADAWRQAEAEIGAGLGE